MISEDDLRSLNARQLDDAIDAARDEVQSLREKHGGTLVGMDGADAETVREKMADLNALAERRDELQEQAHADGQFERLQQFMDEPGPVPGYGSNGTARTAGPSDLGALWLASSAWKAFRERESKDVVARLPLDSLMPGYRGIGETPVIEAALFQTTAFPSQPQFMPTPIQTLYQPSNIGPLMAQGTTTSNTIRYVTETITSTGAASVAEGGSKPEAALSFASVDEPVRKIAVLLPITDEALEDETFLRAYLNARLILFVQMEEDRQLLLGSGTAPELRGIMNRSGINTATSYSIGGTNPDQALVESVFHAAMRVRDSYLEPDTVVMRPSTWELAALAKDGNRNYLLGGPGSVGYVSGDASGGFRLWGLRVVLNTNMPAQVAANKVALVGAFQSASMVIRRSGIDMSISDQHSTFFAENKLMFRAEERLALAVWRPQGFAAITSAT